MQISNSNIDSLGNSGVGAVGGAASGYRTSAGGVGNKSDSVSLSNAANLIALAKSSAASRQSKLQSLSAQLKSGSYQADTDVVSQALVDGHISG
jgi:anti-sigma28 factor (negative regulator of flagellin synthesis)